MKVQNFDTIFPTKAAAAVCVRRAGYAGFMPEPAVAFLLQAIEKLELPDVEPVAIGKTLMPNWQWMIRVVFNVFETPSEVRAEGSSFKNSFEWSVFRLAVPLEDDVPEAEAKAALSVHAQIPAPPAQQ